MKMKFRHNGMALIEVMIAVIVLAIGVLGAVGLQARSISALANAGARVDATIAAEKAIGLMWTDQANLASYAWDSTSGTGVPAVLANWWTEVNVGYPLATPPIAPLLPNATALIAVTPVAGSTALQVGVTLTWQRRIGVVGDKNADQVNTHTIVATLAPTT